VVCLTRPDEFPGQQSTVELYHRESEYNEPPIYGTPSTMRPEAEPLPDTTEHELNLEKSNVMILGPTGVGKTLMCKTLAKTLGIPISMSDCTTFTQAGYIGDDVQSCVASLLSAANYDIEAAEQGIIVLDEIDKIAGAKISYGKDVGGEGVQQALLKIIEGTTVQVQAKPERSAGKGPGGTSGRGSPHDSPGSGGSSGPPGGKGEMFNVRTDNILFICTGAFANLHKIIIDRVAMGGMGFGASIRSSNAHASADGVMLKGADAARFKKDIPFFVPSEEKPNPFGVRQQRREDKVNVLDHVQPADLQKYGLIPELIGRIPTTCAVAALDEEALVRVLTEPKDSLIRQEEYKFQLRNIELRMTQGALREIARKASKMGTGARGLRHVVDHLLLQAKYETPGRSFRGRCMHAEV
jgi:ATP-dependent Clp protease ATP-binding subunit ClpX